MAKPCSIDGCERAAAARTWCHMHWGRWRRNGDPLAVNAKRNAGRRVIDHEDGTRTCNDCSERKALDRFPKDPNATKGRRGICKPCHTAKESARFWSDPAVVERRRAYEAKRRADNPDEMRQRDRERYQRDKPKRLALVVEAGHRRRALLASVPSERGITIKKLRLAQGDRCCYCSVVMDFTPPKDRTYRPAIATLEHVIPLSRGGSHTWDNVKLCCRQCNTRKNSRTLAEWQPDARPEGHDGPEQLLLL